MYFNRFNPGFSYTLDFALCPSHIILDPYMYVFRARYSVDIHHDNTKWVEAITEGYDLMDGFLDLDQCLLIVEVRHGEVGQLSNANYICALIRSGQQALFNCNGLVALNINAISKNGHWWRHKHHVSATASYCLKPTEKNKQTKTNFCIIYSWSVKCLILLWNKCFNRYTNIY